MKKLAALFCLLLLAGCGGAGAPQPPHVYVVGVDCTRSFWSTSQAAERRYAALPKSKLLAIANRARENLSEINILMEDTGFVRQSAAQTANFVKTVDRDTMRRELDNAIDMAAVLGNVSSEAEGKVYAGDRLRANMNGLILALDKRNYVKAADLPAGKARFDEAINPASAKRIHELAARVNAALDELTYTVSVPDQPNLLRSMGADTNVLLRCLENLITQQNGQQQIDPNWAARGVYGKISQLNYMLCFKVGDTAATIYRPSIGDVYDTIGRLVEESASSGLKVFSASSDYTTFFQRGFREIGNLVNDWGNFDHDIGVAVTFIIIGDGKNDPAGKYETAADYDLKLIGQIKELLTKQGENGASAIPGLAWSDIRQINVKFCVPQRRYNTDLLDAWTRELQGTSQDGKIQVHYYMYENLKENGAFSPRIVSKLLE
jgi:hypothetical protein